MSDALAARYYLDLAAAFVRGWLPEAPAGSAEDLVRFGLKAGLRLHKFKRSAELPRVRGVLGMLRGLAPPDLLDVGSGRGVFLWPLLDAFPELPVHAIDTRPDRVADIQAVARGGIARLRGSVMDAGQLEMPDRTVDGVTVLEVLEHLKGPERAVAEAVRVAKRFVIVSVPSKPDDNPEHIHLFDNNSLQDLFRRSNVDNLRVEYVLNHVVALAVVG
jgi:ubiquinone/menaquinone biosynthesis C-methylase UbiE